MRRLSTFFLVLGVLAGSLQPWLVSASVNDFAIDTFEADYYLGQDENNIATMGVTENIVAVFPSINQNHGILRSIPQSYRGQSVDLQINSVVDGDNAPYPYTTYESNDQLVLKIGNASTYVHGETTYKIAYTLRNVISFYDNNDELFWDVNGTEWLQPFGEVTARLHIPANLSNSLLDNRLCYTGFTGSTEQDCKIESTVGAEGKTDITVTAKALSAGENLSLVIAFQPNTFSKDTWPQTRLFLQIAGGAGALLFSIFVLFKQWRKHGKDAPGKGTIVPQYTPPDNLDVLTSDTILNENVRSAALTATLLELAIKGYVQINDISKKDKKTPEYELKLIKSGADLSPNYRTVLAAFFGSASATGTTVEIKDKAHKLPKTVLTLRRSLLKRLTKEGFFQTNPTHIRTKYALFGFGMITAATVLTWAVPDLLMLIPAIGLGLGGILFMIFSNVMPARTEKGALLREYLLGMKDYIKLAEQDRIRFHQSPQGARGLGANPNDTKVQIKLFESLLPYAMIFGLEKEWAKQFKDVYTDQPEWYHNKYNAFNNSLFAASLNSFGAQTNAVFAPASSSGSSGFSGGGGSSGGGGGGGGGGGW